MSSSIKLQALTFEHALEDVESRFLYNLPVEDLQSTDRLVRVSVHAHARAPLLQLAAMYVCMYARVHAYPDSQPDSFSRSSRHGKSAIRPVSPFVIPIRYSLRLPNNPHNPAPPYIGGFTKTSWRTSTSTSRILNRSNPSLPRYTLMHTSIHACNSLSTHPPTHPLIFLCFSSVYI
jgi:hypothetical protein